MKNTVLCFVFSFVFFLVFVSGVAFGISFRPVSASRPSVSVFPDRKELKCTCVPCLPDLFCLKCGHKSRDCPKLAHIFKKGTNAVNAASAPAK